MSPEQIKDALGVASALIMSIPFFRDQFSRRSLKEAKALNAFYRVLTKAFSEDERQATDELLASNALDTACMLLGLMLLALSFGFDFIAVSHAK